MALSTKMTRNFFWSKKVFLFDLDGTLYLGKKLIPGAIDLIARLKSEGKRFFYFTNNSSRSVDDYVSKMRGMGFPCELDQVAMSTHLLISELKRRKLTKIFLLGTPAMEEMLNRNEILQSDEPQVVVVGFDKTLTYAKLERACRLVEAGLSYIVTHPDLFCPTEEGPEPDCGAFAKVIELVTKKKPLAVYGKPHPLMLREIQKRGPFLKRDMILVGDRLMTDIEMGKNFGIDTILVLSGETKARDLNPTQKKRLKIANSVADLL